MNVQGTPRKKNRPPQKKRIMFEKSVSLSSPSTVSDLPSIVSNAPPSAVLDPESDDIEVDQNFVPEILEEFVMPPLNMVDRYVDACHDFHIPMQFSQITRESDVRTFTDFNGTEIFKTIFDAVKRKGMLMTYWDGSKRTLSLCKRPSSIESTEQLIASPEFNLDEKLFPLIKSGPSRKLNLEQEFLLVMMKLRLGLLVDDLVFRFGVSPGKVSQTVITWVKLLSKELSCLIVWPSRKQVRKTARML